MSSRNTGGKNEKGHMMNILVKEKETHASSHAGFLGKKILIEFI